mmetsp:Transcript_54528/g.157671  ORF Transcript_54528/g.157671 Transcript_54528/m.157671 type:complete len:181 (-) Transcript_54528:244-786(-)
MPATSLPIRIFGSQAQGMREVSPLAQQPRLLGSRTPKSPMSPKSPCFFSDAKAQGSPVAGATRKHTMFLTVPTEAAASQATANPDGMADGAGAQPTATVSLQVPAEVARSSADAEARPAASTGVDHGGLPVLLGRELEAEGSKDEEAAPSSSEAPSVAAHQSFLARRERIGSRRFRALGA